MEGTNGRRIHFTFIVTTTPKLIVGAGSRQAVTFVGGAGNIYLGYSGTLTNTGLLLVANTTFHDLFSSDEWWAAVASGSGTMTGFITV